MPEMNPRLRWPSGRRVFAAPSILATCILLSIFMSSAHAKTQKVQEFNGVSEWKLDNGLKLLVAEDRRAPVAGFMVVYKVGSRNESIGFTGATHFLEHLLFKGTAKHNREKGNDFDSVLNPIGAMYNATTWLDRTNYFAVVPVEHLETYMELEADRMRGALIRKEDADAERNVVLNEMERGENNPNEVLDDTVTATAFIAHPYRISTIGLRGDVENVTNVRLREFYDTFYHPGNATAILAGDISAGQAVKLTERYFGKIPAAQKPLPEMYVKEPPQQGERRFVLKRPAPNPLVQIAFHTVDARHPDYPALTVLDAILSGAWGSRVSTRMYQALVEKKLASSAATNPDRHRDPALFRVIVNVLDGVDPAAAEKAALAVLEDVKQNGVTTAEMERAKTQLNVKTIYEREGVTAFMMKLGEAEAVADWRWELEFMDAVAKVTADDVKTVARKYLHEDNRTTGYLVPVSAPPAKGAASTSAGSPGPKFYMEPDAATAAFYGRGDAGPAANTKDGATTVAAAALGANTKPYAERMVTKKLACGATLIVLEVPESGVVTVMGSLPAGNFRNPAGRLFIASQTAQMLNNGTRKRAKLEMAQALESRGINIGFATDEVNLTFEADAIAKEFGYTVAALAEMLREPAFPAEELEKLKLQLQTATKVHDDDPNSRAHAEMSRLLYEPGHPRFIATAPDRLAQIAKLTVPDLKNFHAANYGCAAMTVAVAGKVTAATAFDAFDKALAGFTGGNTTLPELKPGTPAASVPKQKRVAIDGKSSNTIYWAWPVPLRRSDPGYHAAELASYALGRSTLASRLGLKVREEQGLTYGINSSFTTLGFGPGEYTVRATSNPKNVNKVIESAEAVIKDYVKGGMTKKELAEEKSAWKGRHALSLASNKQLVQWLWSMHVLGLGPNALDDMPSRIAGPSLDDVNATIRQYLDPANARLVVAGPKTE